MTGRTATVTAYLLVLAAGAVVEVLARLGVGSFVDLATAVRSGLRHRSTRLGLLFAWWWLGWHFLTDR